jgi:hypothetical protein
LVARKNVLKEKKREIRIREKILLLRVQICGDLLFCFCGFSLLRASQTEEGNNLNLNRRELSRISICLASSRFVRSKMCKYVYIETNEKRESQRKLY